MLAFPARGLVPAVAAGVRRLAFAEPTALRRRRAAARQTYSALRPLRPVAADMEFLRTPMSIRVPQTGSGHKTVAWRSETRRCSASRRAAWQWRWDCPCGASLLPLWSASLASLFRRRAVSRSTDHGGRCWSRSLRISWFRRRPPWSSSECAWPKHRLRPVSGNEDELGNSRPV